MTVPAEKYSITSLPIHQVIEDMGRVTGGQVRIDTNYYTLELPAAVGRGTVSGIDFGYGFGMINYRCTFHQDTEIAFDLQQVHPLKFLYAHKGHFAHRFAAHGEQQVVKTFQNLMVASVRHNGHVLLFEAGVEVSICSVEINRSQFHRRFAHYFEDDGQLFRTLIFDVLATQEFVYAGDYALTLADHVETVLNFPEEGMIRSMFYEGKAYEILVDQWLQYVEDEDRNFDKKLLRRAVVEKIKTCLGYVKDNLNKDLSVPALAERTGLSPSELQQGFQHLTGMTVNSYVREQKLTAGLELLKSGGYNVSETLYMVGFSSLSYFSRKFKERWGVSPSAYMRRNAKEK